MSWTYDIAHPPALDPGALSDTLGAKGASLAVMATELDLPVPAAFVITTAASKVFREGAWPDGLDDEVRHGIAAIEEKVGWGFGDPAGPLVVSVRSAAPVSMPGMLATILNLGLSDETTTGLADVTGDGRFASACRRRLNSMYRESVGTDEVPEDPWEQLRQAIEAVFRSWDSDRAQSYREREGIDDALGVAVVVQAMAFADRDEESGSGVLFTRDPASGEDRLYGDLRFGAQGADEVARDELAGPLAVLEDRLPDTAAELRRYATTLERHYGDMAEIEFTIEQGTLWLLQSRVGDRGAHAALRIALEMGADDDFPLTRAEAVRRVAPILVDPPATVSADRSADVPIVATGLAASPGLAIGAIATSATAATALAQDGLDVILVRTETSADDVRGVSRASGILTTTGGARQSRRCRGPRLGYPCRRRGIGRHRRRASRQHWSEAVARG